MSLGETLTEITYSVNSNSGFEYLNQQNSLLPGPGNIFKRAIESRTNKNVSQKNNRLLENAEVRKVISICSLYQTALNTLSQLKLDILTG